MLSDKLTKPLIICKPQIILEKYLFLRHLLLTSIPSVSLVCEETGFYSGKYPHSFICLSSIPDPRHSSSVLFSHALWSRPHPGSYSVLEHGKHSAMWPSRCQILASKQNWGERDFQVQNSSWNLVSCVFSLLIGPGPHAIQELGAY